MILYFLSVTLEGWMGSAGILPAGFGILPNPLPKN